jgi:hypothetical protein
MHCYIAGAHSDEVPPVPIPNTAVKLISADNTWMETSREDKSVPALSIKAQYLHIEPFIELSDCVDRMMDQLLDLRVCGPLAQLVRAVGS